MVKAKKITLLIFLMLLLSCCAKPGDFCDIAFEFEPDNSDVDLMSEHLVWQIVEHNINYEDCPKSPAK